MDWRGRGIGLTAGADLDAGIRPASYQADFKVVGAMNCLSVSAATSNFRSVSGYWVTHLVQQGLVYRELLTGNYILSLGAYAGGGLSWLLKEVGEKHLQLSDDSPLGPQEASVKLQPFATDHVWFPKDGDNNGEAFAGVPTKLCTGLSQLSCDKQYYITN